MAACFQRRFGFRIFAFSSWGLAFRMFWYIRKSPARQLFTVLGVQAEEAQLALEPLALCDKQHSAGPTVTRA